MLSIVIPTLNEAEVLPATLDALAQSAAEGYPFEVIVVDAGSLDDTAAAACARGCRVVRSPRAQRAAQMNEGAAHARGETLLFLHADTLLPPGAFEQILTACGQSDVAGGAFARRYDSPSRWLRFTCWLARWRNRWFGWHLGDQAIFVRRQIFQRLGGFRDFDVFEDVDFSRRLAREGRLVTLKPPVLSSARRFVKHGAFRRSLVDAWLMCRYALGALPHDLKQPCVPPCSFRPSARSAAPSTKTLRGDADNVEKRGRLVNTKTVRPSL